MLEQYKKYLFAKGYKSSTIRAYSYAITKICENENITILSLSKNINNYVKVYDKGGQKEYLGIMGRNTWINALKRFQEFINSTKKIRNQQKCFQESKKQLDIPIINSKLINEIKQLANEGFEQAKKEHNNNYIYIFREIKQKLGLLQK